MDNLQHIIEGCIGNNHRDQRNLYEKYFGYSLKIVFRYIYRYDTAVDIVTDGFVKLFRNIGKFQYSQSQNIEMMLMGWMRTIMINTAIDHLRRENLLPEIGAIDENIWQEEDKKGQSPDQALLYKEIVIQIKRLPPSYRIVFNMYIIDGFSHQEIANQLGISVGTSKSNLFKARAILQKYIRTENDCYFAETY